MSLNRRERALARTLILLPARKGSLRESLRRSNGVRHNVESNGITLDFPFSVAEMPTHFYGDGLTECLRKTMNFLVLWKQIGNQLSSK